MGRKNKGSTKDSGDKLATSKQPAQLHQNDTATFSDDKSGMLKRKPTKGKKRFSNNYNNNNDRHKSVDPLAIARRQYVHDQNEKRKHKEELNRQRQLKEAEIKKKQKERRRTSRLLRMKTKSGQPVMAHKINYLLNKLQKTAT
ncbi:rRNA-processing protein FYV7 [Trichoplax sp. H2]|uniref:rRNA-processing protein FYV7 n=1 Tax=Trichoplax adhaerens TaxID=10228 RepID=B3RJN1_TRIAD|nr:hypothetical protein TRIADDRAFT_51525 [Trichoplax adhaerens]EDV28525.1 hypothetical protein TRIADDRAFT_51525 [Trichoplax adhaerens]RDD42849.1 rRNA-processing protein FYV7 [Trichoplax sp. H2]|eukprot:XP_002107727.1 hypothetical protein TRIADDRAFT_51525 [Trichoplax adhaerens]